MINTLKVCLQDSECSKVPAIIMWWLFKSLSDYFFARLIKAYIQVAAIKESSGQGAHGEYQE